MLTPEQQAALGGYRPQDRPQQLPAGGHLALRPLPGEFGRPGSYMPQNVTPGMTSQNPGFSLDGLMWLFLGFL